MPKRSFIKYKILNLGLYFKDFTFINPHSFIFLAKGVELYYKFISLPHFLLTHIKTIVQCHICLRQNRYQKDTPTK